MCQINWWLPIYPVLPSNAMALHPGYWNRPMKNGPRTYNYEEWNRTSRLEAAKRVKTDTRVQPKPEEAMELAPQLRLLPATGGIILHYRGDEGFLSSIRVRPTEAPTGSRWSSP